jgi:ATP-dependent Lon protease
MELNEKINKYFEGKVVRKDLTKTIKGNAVVPTYVLEYLLGQHCATFDEEIISDGVIKVKNIIKKHFVHRDEAEVVKSTIKETERHKIIDKVQVHLNDKKNIYEANFSNLGIKRIPIASDLVKRHRKLLTGGVWCIIELGWQFTEGEGPPYLLYDLKPIQISNVDLEEALNLRDAFTTEEWIDLLIHSLGLEPAQFNERSKLIQISRLVPFCENNYNFIELGPKGTGKSHIFSELSPHAILISGGDVTQAKLFVNNTNNEIGLVGYWDLVGFDEFAGSQKSADKKLVDIMKNYMANKSFSRGKDVYGATASFAFIGNTEHSVPYMLKNSNLFDALPKAFYDSAFLDRLHTYLPGWEVSKLRNEMFSGSYGFIVDYLAEILKELRKDDFSTLLKDIAELSNTLTTRDKDGITKTFSGLMKIIFPHQKYSHEEAITILEFAMEGRKRVKDQLLKIDDTFEQVRFEYRDLKSGKTIRIETLENIENEVQNQPLDPNNESETKSPIHSVTVDLLKPGQSLIRENQTGISFQKLFAPYLRGSQAIELVDPYIRLPHQMNLLLEFCSMLSELKSEDQETALYVKTWNEPQEMLSESRVYLEEIAESVFDLGIKLDFQLKPDIHDRYIQSNNGWKIVLGRGLDIFQKPEGRFNIAGFRQDRRRCKACEITYVRIK